MSSSMTKGWPQQHPELLPFVPLVLAICRDGVLSRGDYETFCAHVAGMTQLSPSARDALARWLNPDTPPDRRALVLLREIVRGSASDSDAPTSLAQLGLLLHSGTAACVPWAEEASEALEEIQNVLGFGGVEQVRALLAGDPLLTRAPRATAPEDAGPDPRPASMPPRNDGGATDTGRLATWMTGSHARTRAEVLELLERSELRPCGDGSREIASDEYRERTRAAVQLLADEGVGALGFPEAFGGADDPGGAIAAFETLAFGDLSVLVKFGVQFGLFGGSVSQLGTRRHHEAYLTQIATMQLPGCYAMTETGHGSNVRDLETTARYDHETRELVVNSPSKAAGKDWIGNAACHGRLATVFARLIVEGEDHGVHAMLVPIRNDDGTLASGVTIEDRGLKLGLNGVDNGRIWFHDVRVPVDNLLDRFASIDKNGLYSSPIASDGRRFFTMLRTLVAGRVSVGAAAVSASKKGLTIAVRYAARRRQFGPAGSEEIPILRYGAVQRRLLPRLATTYGLHFACRMLQERFEFPTVAEDPELEVLAAGLKAYASDHCVDVLQTAREVCGGQGYLAAHAFAALKADTDVFTTFEGANPVLYQLVAKGLLSRYREEMGDLSLRGALRYLGDRAETSITELNPLQTRRTESEHLRDEDFYKAALRYRKERMLRSAARRLRSRLSAGMDSFDAVNAVQTHLIGLARAHVEQVIATAFADRVEEAPPGRPREALTRLNALCALSMIEADRGWFLESGYIEPAKSRALRSEVDRLSGEVAQDSAMLIDGLGIPDALLPPIAHRP